MPSCIEFCKSILRYSVLFYCSRTKCQFALGKAQVVHFSQILILVQQLDTDKTQGKGRERRGRVFSIKKYVPRECTQRLHDLQRRIIRLNIHGTILVKFRYLQYLQQQRFASSMDLKTVVALPMEIDISYLIQLFNVMYSLAVHKTPLKGKVFLKLTKEDNPGYT